MKEVSAADVDRAADRPREVIAATPTEHNARLSVMSGLDVWLKREDLQPVRSYKLGGAITFISQLDALQRSRGVVCASAGYHTKVWLLPAPH